MGNYRFATTMTIEIPICWDIKASSLEEAIEKMKKLNKKHYTLDDDDQESHETNDGYASFGWLPDHYEFLNSDYKSISSPVNKELIDAVINQCDTSLLAHLSVDAFHISEKNKAKNNYWSFKKNLNLDDLDIFDKLNVKNLRNW